MSKRKKKNEINYEEVHFKLTNVAKVLSEEFEQYGIQIMLVSHVGENAIMSGSLPLEEAASIVANALIQEGYFDE